MPEPHELPRTECEALIRSDVVGRVAFVGPDGPHIVPINYSVVDGAIIIRTSAYSELGTHGRAARLAFEIDQFDHENQRGWSVVAHGRADVVTDADELDHIDRVWPPQPWASGTRSLHLRLPWDELTGRRLGTGWDPRDSAPVNRVV